MNFGAEGQVTKPKLRAARLYLQQPDIAISEIAYLLGFADPSTFNRAFKRWTGSMPARARGAARKTAAGA